MRRLIAVTLALGLLAGCALVPRTGAQSVFAAQSAYVAASHAEIAYIRSPGADPAVVERIRQLDNRAYATLVPLRAAAQDGRAADAAQIVVAETAVAALAQYLNSKAGAGIAAPAPVEN